MPNNFICYIDNYQDKLCFHLCTQIEVFGFNTGIFFLVFVF